MNKLESIPYSFVSAHVKMCWRDVEYGIKKGHADEVLAIEMAMDHLQKGKDGEHLLELASQTAPGQATELVDALASEEPPVSQNSLQDRWLYLVTAWALDQKDGLDDPLGVVEKIYAEFDYPEAISSFVRYMPMVGPDLGAEANERRLIERWSRYVRDQGRLLKSQSDGVPA